MPHPRRAFGAVLQTVPSQWLDPSAGGLGPMDPNAAGLSPSRGRPLRPGKAGSAAAACFGLERGLLCVSFEWSKLKW